MRGVFSALIVGLITGCAPPPAGPDGLPADIIPSDSDEAIVVRPAEGAKPFQVHVSCWRRAADRRRWNRLLAQTAGVIGPNGFAPLGEKHEGDGRTPSGVYRIGTAFGYQNDLPTDLDFRVATDDDYWVDDPDSPQYNRWVHGKPTAKSFERLRIDAYKYAAVIEYNTDPIVPGKGSAIFLHIWKGVDKPTAGCVALDEDGVCELILKLDRQKKPVIVLNP